MTANPAFTPQGRQAYQILAWANEDQSRVPVAVERVNELARYLADRADGGRALAEVRDVGTVLSRLSDRLAPALASDESITAQIAELAVWTDITPFLSRHHLRRNSHGEFQSSGAPSAPPVAGHGLKKSVSRIAAEHEQRVSQIMEERKPVPDFSPETRSIFQGRPYELPPLNTAQKAGPDLPHPGQPQVDNRIIAAYAKDALSEIQNARATGQLSGADASKVGKAVTSLAKTSQAAGRQLADQQRQIDEGQKRIDRLEQALAEMQKRIEAGEHNAAIQKRVNEERDRRDEEIADQHERVASRRSAIAGITSTLANVGFTLGSFFALTDAAPANPHEWMLAAIPLATAAAQAMFLPLYEAHKEKALAKATKITESPTITQQLANDSEDRAGAVRFWTYIFQQTGASAQDSASVANWIMDNA